MKILALSQGILEKIGLLKLKYEMKGKPAYKIQQFAEDYGWLTWLCLSSAPMVRILVTLDNVKCAEYR